MVIGLDPVDVLLLTCILQEGVRGRGGGGGRRKGEEGRGGRRKGEERSGRMGEFLLILTYLLVIIQGYLQAHVFFCAHSVHKLTQSVYTCVCTHRGWKVFMGSWYSIRRTSFLNSPSFAVSKCCVGTHVHVVVMVGM